MYSNRLHTCITFHYQRILLVVGLLGIFISAPLFAEPKNVVEEPTSAKDSAAHSSDAQTTSTNSEKNSKNLPPDVRVIIDVSGSMKQTDPKNLRKPAVDLIVRLLPDTSRAGLWTFGNSVNMLMPLRAVDAKWRAEAAPKTEQINSIAMFTNIGKALEEVSFDRNNLNPKFKTHIILLTDGVVDISKEAVENAKERQRIISEILPKLHEAGYIIHTIALSSAADTELLKKLSFTTDGLFTTAESADQLMPVFLKILEQAVPAERVPLENNGFLVDASIKEFTALIFRKPAVDKTIIVMPDGQEFSSTSPKDNLNWYHTASYDLITASTPKAGQWKIKTEISPQSRITVVSDLQLSVPPLRNNIRTNDELEVIYSFQENGKTITNKDFLNLIEANALVAQIGKEQGFQISLTTLAPPSDGIYHSKISTFVEQGNYEINVVVDGKTFKREFKHNLSVRDSLLTLEKHVESTADGLPTYSYKVKTDSNIVDLKSVNMTATIKNSQNDNQFKILPMQEGGFWVLDFSPVQPGDYSVDFRAQGELLDGNKLEESLHADSFHYAPKMAEVKSSAASSAMAKPAEESHQEPPKASEFMEKLPLYIGVGLGSLVLLVIGIFGYKMILGGKNKSELDEIEQTLQEQPSSTPSKSAANTNSNVSGSAMSDSSDSSGANNDNSMEELFPLDSLEDPSDNKE